MEPVAHLIEQLWAPLLASGDARVIVGAGQGPDWRDSEAYWLIPDAHRARLLLPRASAAVTAGAASHYRGLRARPAQAVRAAAAVAARAGVPLSRHTARLQVRIGSDAAERRPLALLADALGVSQLYCSLGVRTGANRKPTLSLVGTDGRPVGYAKIGWNDHTDAFVTTEADTLEEIGGRDGGVRAPGVLARLQYAGHPVVVTAPLPLDAQGHGRAGRPTPRELFALTPVVRHAAASATEHWDTVRGRIARAAADPRTSSTARRAQRLVERIEGATEAVPVTTRWHGDLTSWNVARDSEGRLWIWDWETAEADAVAGLDALHWMFSEQRLRVDEPGRVQLAQCLDQATPYLVAAGVPRACRSLVAAVYVLTVVERACTLAIGNGWERVWIRPEALTGLVEQAEGLLGCG